ncbi:helix-turn-helix transcriptional regulator [Vagococcus carniphilus]|uniref:helix-turn-helix domain-containing protein n=1 Tax=Vagococcus carniphilus TaxID=218144 RepID=UPI00288D6C97|nr:helix-turn-helix transcriptional regulator [Vagococcus carniphilus]MDT2832379.1 helix-turn-helix transcriptional regulator [Vagococcus carniphilus]MDT2840734.1 helix-turn-helix transcriptional regulator [Vagococcus carniphilus]MDT2855809.1 helix-turn-helix transcriptional regulator [Vagococcus carniphilus]
MIEQSSKEYDKLENEKESILTKLQIKTSDYNQLNNDYKRIKNNYDELSKKKPDKKLKQRNKELEKLLKDSENLIKANTIYRKTYEYISDAKNKQSVKEAFQHNLKLWMENENLSNVKAAELLDVSVSMIAEWKNGRTALTVKTIQEVDLVLCEYFECSVYELVTVKVEGEEEC